MLYDDVSPLLIQTNNLFNSTDRTMQDIVYRLVPGLQERKLPRTMI